MQVKHLGGILGICSAIQTEEINYLTDRKGR